jgi:hypothetical protein
MRPVWSFCRLEISLAGAGIRNQNRLACSPGITPTKLHKQTKSGRKSQLQHIDKKHPPLWLHISKLIKTLSYWRQKNGMLVFHVDANKAFFSPSHPFLLQYQQDEYKQFKFFFSPINVFNLLLCCSPNSGPKSTKSWNFRMPKHQPTKRTRTRNVWVVTIGQLERCGRTHPYPHVLNVAVKVRIPTCTQFEHVSLSWHT